ncbi:MAG: tetratricopeptide repeat protein [Flavobacteriales bacterium]|nr:tetratricopeptide repeat protein [Flavobacteriales bacterium]
MFKRCQKLLLLFLLVPTLGMGIPPSATNQIDSLNHLIKTTTDKSEQINLLNKLGYSYFSSEKYQESITSLNKALTISKEIKNKKRIAQSAGNLANTYSALGDYSKAIPLNFLSLKTYEEIEDSLGMARALMSIGNIYDEQGLSDESLKKHQEALDIFNQLKDSSSIALVLSNIAIVYAESYGNYDKALIYNNQALSIYKKLNNKEDIARLLNNIGTNYYNTNAYNKALKLYEESLSIREQIADKSGMSSSLMNLAELYVKKHNLNKALTYAKMSFDLSQEIDALLYIKESSRILSEVYKEMGNSTEELKYYKLYSETKDSLFNQNTATQVVKMSAIYETEKKQKEIELLNKEKEKQAALSLAENKRKNTIIFSIIGGLALVIIFSIFLFKRFRVTNQQKIVIEEKQKEITDSITYAKRIQEAILPPESIIKNLLPNSFFLYKPKDIVSGDFYWLEQKDNKILFAAVDCTGHGVPGAFVSIVGHNGLTRSINEFGLTQPAQILNKLNELVEETLRQKDNEVRDGMDISLCSIDFSNNQLQYAGANNPLYLVRNGEIQITKADKQPIGGTGENKRFTNHTIELQKNDSIYIFSDGFADQFGGLKDKKYGYAQFRKLLLSIQNKPMLEQLNSLDTEFNNWKGETEQLDDVCVIGVRI